MEKLMGKYNFLLPYIASNAIEILADSTMVDKLDEIGSKHILFAASSSLKVHMKSHNVEPKTYHCKLCNKDIQGLEGLQQHLSKHNPECSWMKDDLDKIQTVQVAELITTDQAVHTLQIATVSTG